MERPEKAFVSVDFVPRLSFELPELRNKPSLAPTIWTGAEFCVHSDQETPEDVFIHGDIQHSNGGAINTDNKSKDGHADKEHGQSSMDEVADIAGSERHSLRFWLVFAALCMTSLLGGLDTTVTSTALATISSDIGGQEQYVWFANVSTVTMTAVQPLFGQLANIFGRRYMTLLAVGFFILGSGLAGAAINPVMLIGGRAVQGIGSGALMMLQDLVVCDLVPVRERAKYISIFTASAGVAASLGPLIGGAMAEWNWRWIFYINLPIGGLAFLAVALLLNTKHTRSPTWMHALLRIDYVGNAIFITAVVSLLLGIVMGGQNVFPWSSWRVVLPLVMGVIGLAAFIAYERTPACKEPTIPLELFQNRTSAIAFVLTFCSGMLLQWISYFLPIFYQGVQLATPTRSGERIIPLNVFLIVMAIVAGNIISVTGKYVPLHIASFAFMALALGLFTRFDQDTKVLEWVFLQIVAGTGLGFTMNTPLTALQASLSDTYNAAATAMFGFVHTLAFTWGVTIPAVIFNADIANNIWRLNLTLRSQNELANGRALGFTTRASLMSVTDVTEREKIITLFTHAIKMTWYAGMGVALIGLGLCFGEKQIQLRTAMQNNDFGMEDGKTGGVEDVDNAQGRGV